MLTTPNSTSCSAFIKPFSAALSLCMSILLLQASGPEPPEGHFMTVLQKCSPGPLSRVYFRQDSTCNQKPFFPCLFACLTSVYLLGSVHGTRQPLLWTSSQQVFNEQANEWTRYHVLICFSPKGHRTRIWVQVVYLEANFRREKTATTESCGDRKEVGEWDSEGTETGNMVDFCVHYYYGQLELFLGALGAE